MHLPHLSCYYAPTYLYQHEITLSTTRDPFRFIRPDVIGLAAGFVTKQLHLSAFVLVLYVSWEENTPLCNLRFSFSLIFVFSACARVHHGTKSLPCNLHFPYNYITLKLATCFRAIQNVSLLSTSLSLHQSRH